MLVGTSARRVAIVGGSRIPFARGSGAYATAGNQELLTAALRGLVERFGLQGERLDEVAAGAVLKHSSQWNLTREAVLDCGLAPQTPGLDLQRACGSSLEAAVHVGNKIALGQIDCGIAAGVDTASDPPVAFPRIFQQLLIDSLRGKSRRERILPWLQLRLRHLQPVLPGLADPRTGLSMGAATELMIKAWNIDRTDQDQLAYQSHRKAAAAWAGGFYSDLVRAHQGLAADDNIRSDTSLEKLAGLPPAFAAGGSLTAGNSTPLTDGAAAVLLASEAWARAHNLPVLAYLSFGKAAAVDCGAGDELLMAPSLAVAHMLADAGIRLGDFDFYEIHEAFAGQVLCALKAWSDADFCRERLGLPEPLGAIERHKLNVMGGSIAIGHPFAATGARMLATLAKTLDTNRAKRGLIALCTAGGMGVCAILER